MMTDEAAKTMIERLKHLQEKKIPFPCPRCGHDRMDSQNPVRNALSRYADVYICDECGTEEAMADFGGMKPLPFSQWSMAISFDEEGVT